MGMLPSVMPPHFNNTYTPIAAAGTDAQVNHTFTVISGPGSLSFCLICIESLQMWIKTFKNLVNCFISYVKKVFNAPKIVPYIVAFILA
jgi:hypothetical protein